MDTQYAYVISLELLKIFKDADLTLDFHCNDNQVEI